MFNTYKFPEGSPLLSQSYLFHFYGFVLYSQSRARAAQAIKNEQIIDSSASIDAVNFDLRHVYDSQIKKTSRASKYPYIFLQVCSLVQMVSHIFVNAIAH